MAYARRQLSDMEAAMDSLGSSYLDGIPVTISPRFQMPFDLNAIQASLNQPMPNLDAIDQWKYDCHLERQVLEQLRILDEEKERKAKEEEEARREYRERKEKERKEREEAEAEEKRRKEEEEQEEQRKRQEELEKAAQEEEEEAKAADSEETAHNTSTEQESPAGKVSNSEEMVSETSAGSDDFPSAAAEKPPSAPTSPPNAGSAAANALPSAMAGMAMSSPPAATPPAPKANINFSEFEAESDPFDSMELKTINELKELADVLQNTSSTVPSSTQQQQQQLQQQSVYTAAGAQQQQHQFQQGYAPRMNQQFGGVQGMPTGYPPQGPYYPPSSQSGFQQPQQPPQQPPPARPHQAFLPYPQQHAQQYFPVPGAAATGATATPPSGAIGSPEANSGTLKSSKSFGDIMSEIKKEGDAVARMKSSRTPPPRAAIAGGRGMEDWVPWPDLDSSTAATASVTAAAAKEEDDPLRILTKDSQKELCRQIHDMGFPMDRVVRTCQALGEDSQQIIHFCLLVDQIAEKEKYPEKEVEHVLHLKSMDEEATRKHLRAFMQLKDLGFVTKDIHDALVVCGGSHEKALEHLLK